MRRPSLWFDFPLICGGCLLDSREKKNNSWHRFWRLSVHNVITGLYIISLTWPLMEMYKPMHTKISIIALWKNEPDRLDFFFPTPLFRGRIKGAARMKSELKWGFVRIKGIIQMMFNWLSIWGGKIAELVVSCVRKGNITVVWKKQSNNGGKKGTRWERVNRCGFVPIMENIQMMFNLFSIRCSKPAELLVSYVEKRNISALKKEPLLKMK